MSLTGPTGRRHGALSIIEGYLLKRSSTDRTFSPSWKKRYFVLTKHGLSYYKHKAGGSIRVIPLSEFRGVEPVEESEARRKWVFRVLAKPDLVLAASSVLELDLWLDKLNGLNSNKSMAGSMTSPSSVPPMSVPFPAFQRRRNGNDPYDQYTADELRSLLSSHDSERMKEEERIREKYEPFIKELMSMIAEIEQRIGNERRGMDGHVGPAAVTGVSRADASNRGRTGSSHSIHSNSSQSSSLSSSSSSSSGGLLAGGDDRTLIVPVPNEMKQRPSVFGFGRRVSQDHSSLAPSASSPLSSSHPLSTSSSRGNGQHPAGFNPYRENIAVLAENDATIKAGSKLQTQQQQQLQQQQAQKVPAESFRFSQAATLKVEKPFNKN